MITNPKNLRILLIKRGAIGDILLTTPMLRQLKQHNPGIVIEYCTAQSMLGVLQNNANLTKVITLADKAFTFKGIYQLIRFIIGSRAKYDYVFILGKSWYMNIICRLFKSITIGFAREGISKIFLNKYVEYNDVERYQGLYYLDLLTCSGLVKVDYNDVKLDLSISDLDIAKVDLLVKLHHLADFVVIVNSGGNNQFESGGIRMLPEDLVIDLITQLLKTTSVVLLGSGIDKATYQAYVDKLAAPTGLYNWATELSLAESCYLIKLAKKFYTTDCGAMHLGVVVDKKNAMTAIFGPTNPAHIIPDINEYKVIWHDQDLFDENYQLNGTLQQKPFEFFSSIRARDIL